MTSKNDNLIERQNKYGEAEANNQGAPKDGYSDPELKYPKYNYIHQAGTNKASRGEDLKNLSIRNGIPGDDCLYEPHTIAKYPHVQVDESVSGHVIEINDTPGGDRILIMHNTGAGVEMKPDGSIIVNATNHRVDIVNGQHRMSVEGDGNIIYYGNLKMTVNGDYDLDVKGDFKVKVGGNWISNIYGSVRNKINGAFSEIIRKTKSSTIVGAVAQTCLNTLSSFVKGTFRHNVNGEANYHHSGDTLFTSETEIDISSESVNIGAQSLSIFGDTGTIGGENIILYSYNCYVGHAVQSETVTASKSMKTIEFHGDLNGDAKTAGFASVASGLGGGGRSHNAQAHTPDTTKTVKPTADIMSSYLHESANGIREVRIDETNDLKNNIDLKEKTGNVTSRPHTTSECRSRMKDKNHQNNSSYINEMIKNGSLNPACKKGSPSKIGRIRGEASTVTTGIQGIGTAAGTLSTIKKLKPTQFASKSTTRNIAVDPRFNPNTKSEITMKTLLAPGVPMSKFVASYGDPFTLSHITSQDERKSIARNLIPQAEVLNLFLMLKRFNGYNLVVAEGLYKPEPDENYESGGLKDLAQQGRVVSYELYNTKGEHALEKLYDLAVYLKDNIQYDKLILSYDNYDPSGNISGQITIVQPVIGEDFSGKFKMEIATHFNDKEQSSSDLIEVLA